MSVRLRYALILCAAVVATTASVAARQTFTRQDAERFRLKLAKITQAGDAKTARPSGNLSTVMSDAEVNAYLRYEASDQIPPGIVDPTLSALGGGRIGGRAVVDLDSVRRQKQRGWLDPLAYMTGSLPLTATGTLVTSQGVGRFQLESAAIGGVAVPKSILQELLTYYSKSPENPNGIDMDAPFELPARIREIRVDVGQAIVVQ